MKPKTLITNKLREQDNENKKYLDKQWFEDWHYETNGKGGIEIQMPNTKSHGHIIKFRRISDARVKLLVDWFLCSLDQIQRDHGGYKQ